MCAHACASARVRLFRACLQNLLTLAFLQDSVYSATGLEPKYSVFKIVTTTLRIILPSINRVIFLTNGASDLKFTRKVNYVLINKLPTNWW